MTRALGFMAVGLFGFSFANATNFFEVRDRINQATPFQLLKAFYLEASQPATLDDFDFLSTNAKAKLRCAYAEALDRDAKEIFITKHIVPSTQPLGPAFPARAVSERQILLVQDKGLHSTDELLSEVAPTATVTSTRKDLSVEYPEGINNRNHAYRILLRKDGNFIGFEGTGIRRHYFGYCWREKSNR